MLCDGEGVIDLSYTEASDVVRGAVALQPSGYVDFVVVLVGRPDLDDFERLIAADHLVGIRLLGALSTHVSSFASQTVEEPP